MTKIFKKDAASGMMGFIIVTIVLLAVAAILLVTNSPEPTILTPGQNYNQNMPTHLTTHLI